MKPFLKELAEKLIESNAHLEQLTIVFPNKRAALFFRKYLAELLHKPVWSPSLISLEELFAEHTTLQEVDRLDLVFRLFSVYRKEINNKESFDQFYFWGDMLLRDFDEVDKYVVNATLLFKDLSKLRELDESFDYLTDEQKEFLKNFWLNFEEKPVGSKEQFLKVWKGLAKVYTEFTKALLKEGLGYEGMIHRQVAEKLKKAKGVNSSLHQHIIFAGFNALTKAEEILMSYYVSGGASVYWDADTYYVLNKQQEAGQFFRAYKNHAVLGRTFSDDIPSNFLTTANDKTVNLIGVAQKVGQAKLVGQQLEEKLAVGLDPEKTVVVLADESMLLPILHSLPPYLENVNVTMGYPLRNVPLYNLLELLIDLQINRKGEYFNHRQVVAILSHAYVLMIDPLHAHEVRQDIIHKNRILIATSKLQPFPFLASLFQAVDGERISTYLLGVVQAIGSTLSAKSSFDQEYTFHFYKSINRLHKVLQRSEAQPDIKGYQKLFRQVIQSQRIPFAGEPLKGLQVMGVLETRNLDFENVFIVSLNEGLLPAAPRQGSYIPNAIRKAYSLPTNEHQDSIYAYLFYRVLQRAKNITLLYNTEPDMLGMGEMSRFVKQLVYESGWKINHFMLTNALHIKASGSIVIPKSESIIQQLQTKYSDPNGRGLSPSALNEYIECSLRFYLKHLAGLKEAEEVEEELDARVFGNFLHNVMHRFYVELIEAKSTKEIVAGDLEKTTTSSKIDLLIDKEFINHYKLDPEIEVEYKGQRLLVKEIVKQFAERIILLDKEYAPFSIEMLEQENYSVEHEITTGKNYQVVKLAGRIDRVDKKDGVVRVIDYKTGADSLTFKNIESFFMREGKRNKAAFQTVLYSWMYHKKESEAGIKILQLTPGLINRTSLFENQFQWAFKLQQLKQQLNDVQPFLGEFEDRLSNLLQELFDPSVSFIQTKELNNCKFCAYKNICRR